MTEKTNSHSWCSRYFPYFFWALLFSPFSSNGSELGEFVRTENVGYPGDYTLVWYYTAESDARKEPAMVRVQDREFFVDSSVKPPTINSVFLLEHGTVRDGDAVLDMGTGTGLHAIFAAERAAHVVATDIEPKAIDNAKRNADHNGVADRIDFRVGDLFGALKDDEKFDVIFWNIAYPFDKTTLFRWNLHERFFAGVRNHMNPGARIYYQIGFVWNLPFAINMINRNHLEITQINMVSVPGYEREPIFMMVQEFSKR